MLDPHSETSSRQPSGAWNLDVAPRVFDNCRLLVDRSVECSVQMD
jgi:hypothetical protein